MSWGKVPYSLGSWVSRGPAYPPSPNDGPYFAGSYKEFMAPDDRIYFAGDHCSHIIGWQEGAALAAQRAVKMIVSRINQS
jgi:monoamine oxidase